MTGPTDLVGRASELAAAQRAMTAGRLVTLVGPAGVGKTRLALAVAGWSGLDSALVELVPGGEAYLTAQVAAALGVTERPGQPLEPAMHERLAGDRFLLVLDAYQHAPVAVAGLVGRLLESCAGLAVLATGQRQLGRSGECALAVPPLPVSDAVALYAARADADPSSGQVNAETVGPLGGNPLAIELAAAGGGSVAGGLQAVIERGHDQLDDAERRLLRRLGVFVRGFDAETATRVGGGGRLDRLAQARLVVPAGDGRWRLPDAVRARALSWLAGAGEEAATRARHLDWAADEVAALERLVEAGRPWRARFDLVVDELRAALASPAAGPAAHRLARGLGHLCYARQFLHEARHHLQRAAELAPAGAAAADLRTAAHVSLAQHLGEPAMELLRESARRAVDGADRAIALAIAATTGSRFPATFEREVPHQQLCGLLEEARRAAPPGDSVVAAYLAAAETWNATGLKTTPDAALARSGLAAARATGDPVLIVAALDALISGAGAGGRFQAAQDHGRERVRQFELLPRHDPRCGVEVIDVLHVAPLVATAAGDLRGAVAAARRAWDDPFSGLYMRASKHIAPLMLTGEFDEALTFAASMWDGWQRAGRPAARWMAPAVHAAALVYGLRGLDDEHRLWVERAYDLAAPRHEGRIADSFAAYADVRLALHRGEPPDAAVDLSGVDPWYSSTHQFYDAYAWALAAEAAVMTGRPDAAAWLEAAVPAGAECAWAAACLARARGRSADDPAMLREAAAGFERIGARFERACTLALLPGEEAQARAELAAMGCAGPAGW